jgi:AcrR family transcriptional regulator
MDTNERRERLRDDLVAAARGAIERAGLSSLKARELAAEAGCAVGAIYNVFPDLDALVLAVNAGTLERFESFVAGRREPEASPEQALTGLADAYLDFAAANPHLWRALFQHRLPDGKSVPDWYLAAQARLFAHVEAPLGRLCPGLGAGERALLARTLFSATHGMVALGLDEKLVPIPLETLRAQLATVVSAMARGLAQGNALKHA